MSDFAPDARVRVKDDWPETRGPVHIRTPHYLRGMQGKVVRQLGDFPNPEDLPSPGRQNGGRSITWRSTSRPSGRKAEQATNCWWRSSNIGWSRHDDGG